MKKLKSLSVIFIAILLVTSLTGCSPDPKPLPKKQSLTNPTTKFLNYSKQSIALNNRNLHPFSILDNNIKNKQIFFLGEIHGIENNEKIDFEMLKYLQKKVGINYYLAEMGYSSAYFINQYLETGDEKYLNLLFSDFEGTVGWTKEGYDSWKNIYSYNKNLPKNKKIKVVGIDLEHQYELGLMHMNSILPKKSIPSSISPVIDELTKINKTKAFDPTIVKEFLLKLKQDMKNKPSIYKEYLGNKLFDFQQITQNIINDFEFSKIEEDWYKSSNLRDKMIYDNFDKIYNHLPKGSKFYGLWGRPHTYQKQRDNINYVAALMNKKDSKVKNKVLSIAIYYKDCYRLAINNNGNYGKEAYSDDNSLTNPLNRATTSNINIFRLTGAKSPFNRGLSLVENPTGGGRTIDYIQYVILIKNAGPSAPLR